MFRVPYSRQHSLHMHTSPSYVLLPLPCHPILPLPRLTPWTPPFQLSSPSLWPQVSKHLNILAQSNYGASWCLCGFHKVAPASCNMSSSLTTWVLWGWMMLDVSQLSVCSGFVSGSNQQSWSARLWLAVVKGWLQRPSGLGMGVGTAARTWNISYIYSYGITYGPHKAVAEVSNHNEPIGRKSGIQLVRKIRKSMDFTFSCLVLNWLTD